MQKPIKIPIDRLNDIDLSKAECIYFFGGYTDVSRGCPPWGSVNVDELLYYGDTTGYIDFITNKGNITLPLVSGYTSFIRQAYDIASLSPFNGIAKVDFEDAMYLYGASRGVSDPILKVSFDGLEVLGIEIRQAKKSIKTLFTHFTFYEESGKEFFASHTVGLKNVFPEKVQLKIEKVYNALYTFANEKQDGRKYPVPNGLAKIRFSGGGIFDIANNVYSCTIDDIVQKIDEEYNFNASTPGAPNYFYDGFGGYKEGAGQYGDKFYSRDYGIGINALCELTHADTVKIAERAIECAEFFGREKLTFGSLPISAHFPVVINEPLYYSKVLAKHGWPTIFTKEKYGEEYANLGNLETDGHGLSMLALLKTARANSDRSFFEKHTRTLKELADFIVWQLDNPQMGLSKDDLLYAESEAGMCDYTLACNIPCLIALKEWSVYFEEFSDWYDRLKNAIESKLCVESDGKKCWNTKKFGFYHDCVLRTYRDFYGSGYESMLPDGWFEISANTYPHDTSYMYYGARGTGYDHCNILSNALLLDKTEDAKRYFENLMRVCYAPRQPFPYLPPEGYSFDGRAYRRQGDLGNLAQEGEVLNVFRHIAGLGLRGDILIFEPRRLGNNGLEIKGYRVVGVDNVIMVDATVRYHGNFQSVEIQTDKPVGMEVRFGGFYSRERKFEFNAKDIVYELENKDAETFVRVRAGATRKFSLCVGSM